ncbi:Na(+)/H(+) antiporter subunit F [bacterium BMS3Abin04]|nr:Na(+)/H(+) antiporter subunit F [bacterium BMS3Abin04]
MIWIFLGIVLIASILAAIRGVLGPTASDRIIALDNLTTITTAGLVLLGYLFQRYIYIDVSLIYGVLSFVGVLTLARYMEGGL